MGPVVIVARAVMAAGTVARVGMATVDRAVKAATVIADPVVIAATVARVRPARAAKVRATTAPRPSSRRRS